MKKIGYLLMIIMLFSSTIYSVNAQSKLTEKETTMIQIITNDFKESHNININEYDFFDIKEALSSDDNLTSKEKFLTNVYLNIVKKQDVFDISPIIYINKANNKGYVLEKKLNGMNHLYPLYKSDQN